VLNSLLVSLLVLLLFRNPWVAALAGLLFGVPPLTVEPIPWVGQRKTLLAAFFSLCCLCLYVSYASRARDAKRGKRSGWPYLGSLAAYAPALLSKPTSLSVVALVFVLDFWPLRRLGAYLESAGNYAGAIAQYREILRLDPEHAQAKLRLRAVEEKQRRAGLK
jgi:4-amino-4-deoxy-L-arabinose transferase-like glycosyltransferase